MIPSGHSDFTHAETQPRIGSVFSLSPPNEWATKRQHSPTPTFQTVECIVAKAEKRSELGSRDVWAKGKKVSMQSGSSSSESRAEAPGWRLGFRPNDERLGLDGVCRSSAFVSGRSYVVWVRYCIVHLKFRSLSGKFSVDRCKGNADEQGTEGTKFPVEERTSKGVSCEDS